MRCLTLLLLILATSFVTRAEAQTSVPIPTGEKRNTSKSVYWTSRSGGYIYRWTGQDLTATNASTKKTVFSVVQALKKEFGNPTPDDADTIDARDHYEVSFLPLSVVGSLLSYERDDYWDGGAHPSGNESFVTVDMRKPTRPVRLTDLFPPEQIRQALLNDSIVRRVLKREKITPPATLDGLVKALANKYFGGDEDYMYSFPEGMLESFAFHHVENDKVAVRFLMPHGGEVYRFQNTQLGILLPIPARLKPALTKAAANKSGALMQSLRRTTKDRSSSLTLIE